ncbi:MAG: hypothetical protein H7331_11310 [Bacteroidia bacterium]|nr:hypothetical protein [Bacteroidia bacterium]
MKKIIYLLAIVISTVAACKKTTGLVEKNSVSPNTIDTALFEPKASYVLDGTIGTPRYIPCTVTATNTSILADSSLWCFIKNGKYVVVSRERNFKYNYTSVAKDTLILIVKNKAGQADTNTSRKIETKNQNDVQQHVITILNKPVGAQTKEITIDNLLLTTATKVFVAVYHNGVRIDDSKLSVIGESWEVSTIRSLVSTSTITTTQLPYKFPFPQNLAPFRFLSVGDIYTFKAFDTDINGVLIDEATIKIADNFGNGVPDAPTFIYAQNISGTFRLKLKITKWY